MPDLGFTDTMDVVMRAGPAKAAKLAEIKYRGPYSPAVDFYRGIREAISGTHAGALAKAHLIAEARSRAGSNDRKLSHFGTIAANYVRWWGRKSIAWFDPPRAIWTSNGVSVTVNPELGLVLDGEKHLVKLHLKRERLPHQRCGLALELMHTALGVHAAGATLSILDVRARKLHSYVPNPLVQAQLVAETAWIAALWPHL